MFKWIISCFVIVILIFALARPGGGEETVNYDSFGKIKIGMTIAQAQKVAQIRLSQLNGKPNQKEGCFYIQPFNNVRFMIVEGKIATFEINSSGVKTTKGIKIGDEEYNLATYGIKNFQVVPINLKRYFIYTPPQAKNYRIIFETVKYIERYNITRYRAGKLPEVNYPIGCANYSQKSS